MWEIGRSQVPLPPCSLLCSLLQGCRGHVLHFHQPRQPDRGIQAGGEGARSVAHRDEGWRSLLKGNAPTVMFQILLREFPLLCNHVSCAPPPSSQKHPMHPPPSRPSTRYPSLHKQLTCESPRLAQAPRGFFCPFIFSFRARRVLRAPSLITTTIRNHGAFELRTCFVPLCRVVGFHTNGGVSRRSSYCLFEFNFFLGGFECIWDGSHK